MHKHNKSNTNKNLLSVHISYTNESDRINNLRWFNKYFAIEELHVKQEINSY